MNCSSARLTELSIGVAGNLACHNSTASCLARAAALRSAVFEHAVLRDDTACLSEVCRLLSSTLQQQSSSQPWLDDMLCDAFLDRLGWIMSNTLNSALLERYSHTL